MTLKEGENYLENRAEAAVAELIQVGEEIGSDLESVEFKEEVKGVEFVLGIVWSGRIGGPTGSEGLQAGEKRGEKPHKSIKPPTLTSILIVLFCAPGKRKTVDQLN